MENKKGNLTIVNDVRDSFDFVMIDKKIFPTNELSLGAKGLLIYMIHKESPVTISQINIICSDTTRKITNYINELLFLGIIKSIEYTNACNFISYKYEINK